MPNVWLLPIDGRTAVTVVMEAVVVWVLWRYYDGNGIVATVDAIDGIAVLIDSVWCSSVLPVVGYSSLLV